MLVQPRLCVVLGEVEWAGNRGWGGGDEEEVEDDDDEEEGGGGRGGGEWGQTLH